MPTRLNNRDITSYNPGHNMKKITANDTRILHGIKTLQLLEQKTTFKKLNALTMVSEKTIQQSIKRLIKARLLLATREHKNQPYKFTILNGGNNGD